jgi:hypothetical protein
LTFTSCQSSMGGGAAVFGAETGGAVQPDGLAETDTDDGGEVEPGGGSSFLGQPARTARRRGEPSTATSRIAAL